MGLSSVGILKPVSFLGHAGQRCVHYRPDAPSRREEGAPERGSGAPLMLCLGGVRRPGCWTSASRAHGGGAGVLDDLQHLSRELLVVYLQPVDVRAPARARLGEVHRVLDLLLGRPVELRHLRVEERAVAALGCRRDGYAYELTILVGYGPFFPLDPLAW